jgi:hypothetical protein
MARKQQGGSVAKAIVYGGLTAASLDLLSADLIYRVDLITVMHSIARGWYGPSAMSGGADVAVVGLASHYAILTVAAAIFVLTSLRFPVLRRLWWLTGPAFGLGIWVVMHYLVVPYSHAGQPIPDWPLKTKGMEELVGHLFLVGLPIAGWARRLLGR